MGFPGSLDSKESACNTGDPGSTSGLGRFPEEGNGYPLQYSCLENSIRTGSLWATQSVGSQRVGHDLETEQTATALVESGLFFNYISPGVGGGSLLLFS